MIPINDLTRHDSPLSSWYAEAEAVSEVVTGGWFFGGPATRAFESGFSDYLGVGGCAGVASGTDALTLALAALEVGPGSRVATVANAGFYTSLACRRLGALPVYVDVDPETACMDAERLDEVLDGSFAAVVVTHLYGQAAEMDRILGITGRWGVPVLEDCAQAAGARIGGQMVGSFGAVSAFSFYPTKNLGAVGDAGAVATNDEALLARVRSMAQYGWGRKYEVDFPGGMNSRLDEIQAAVLSVRLGALDELNHVRRGILRRYQAVAKSHGARLFFTDDASHVGHLAVVTVSDRDMARRALCDLGVQTEIHYPIPDYRQRLVLSEAQPFTGAVVELPVTEGLSKSVLTVPCFPTMTAQEIGAVVEGLDQVLSE